MVCLKKRNPDASIKTFKPAARKDLQDSEKTLTVRFNLDDYGIDPVQYRSTPVTCRESRKVTQAAADWYCPRDTSSTKDGVTYQVFMGNEEEEDIPVTKSVMNNGDPLAMLLLTLSVALVAFLRWRSA